jgi:hypothetical protein
LLQPGHKAAESQMSALGKTGHFRRTRTWPESTADLYL